MSIQRKIFKDSGQFLGIFSKFHISCREEYQFHVSSREDFDYLVSVLGKILSQFQVDSREEFPSSCQKGSPFDVRSRDEF